MYAPWNPNGSLVPVVVSLCAVGSAADTGRRSNVPVGVLTKNVAARPPAGIYSGGAEAAERTAPHLDLKAAALSKIEDPSHVD